MEYLEYIKPELLVLVPALNGLGAILKKTKKISDAYIPLILTGVALALTCLYVFGTEGFSVLGLFTAIVQGFVTVSMAVYNSQLIIQAKG